MCDIQHLTDSCFSSLSFLCVHFIYDRHVIVKLFVYTSSQLAAALSTILQSLVLSYNNVQFCYRHFREFVFPLSLFVLVALILLRCRLGMPIALTIMYAPLPSVLVHSHCSSLTGRHRRGEMMARHFPILVCRSRESLTLR
jgi:hypothetical protein